MRPTSSTLALLRRQSAGLPAPRRAAARHRLHGQSPPATSTAGNLLSARTSGSHLLSRSLFTRKTPAQKAKARFWTATGLILGGLLAVYAYDSSAGIHRWLVIPILHLATKDDPEASHRFAVRALASGLTPVDVSKDDEELLGFELFGRHFSNPVGLAAGFDKHGEAIDGLFKLGFSYVEIGSVTPHPQEGNEKPRLFRLPSTQSVINRYGFNSEGHIPVLARLKERIHAFIVNNALLLPPTSFPAPPISAQPEPDAIDAMLTGRTDADVIDSLPIPRSLQQGKVLAVNLGKNKVSAPDSIDDYVEGVARLGPYTDVLVINVSSPNTPGLRSLQKSGIVHELLSEVVKARDALSVTRKPAVVLKIAPDLSRQEVADIASAATQSKVDGIIVSNTTVSRPASAGTDPALNEAGGLSGPPLKPLALRTLQHLYALTSGSIPLIGCGGISTGADALDYARAGASFVQLYTALGYHGVGLPRLIKNEITATLRAEGKTWKQVVGSGVDLDSVQRLGRESNAVSLLGLEEEAQSGMKQLKEQIELAVYGKIAEAKKDVERELVEPPLALRGIPSWSESPAQTIQATIPKSTIADSVSAESGLVPYGYPQIIIRDDKFGAYKPAPAWTEEDVQERVDSFRETASQLGKDLKEAGSQTVATFRAVGEDIKDDALVDVTKEAAKQTAQDFRDLAHDVRHDPLARDIKEAARQSGAAFGDLGRAIANDDFAKDVVNTTAAAARESVDAFRALGRNIATDPFLDQVRDVSAAAAKETVANFKKIGRDIKDDQFYEDVDRITRDAVSQTISNFRKVGRDIRDDAFLDEVAETTRGAVSQSARNFEKIGKDIKDDNFLQEVRDALVQASRQAASNFRALGREVVNDPAYDVLRSAGRDLQRDTEAGLRTGPTGDGGVWAIGSTFGMRGKVTSDSKRLV